MHTTPRLINIYATPGYRVIMIRRLLAFRRYASPRGIAYTRTFLIVMGVKLALAFLGFLTLTK